MQATARAAIALSSGRGGERRRDLSIGDLLVRKDVQDHDADQTEGVRGRPGARSHRGRRDRVGPAARGRAPRAAGRPADRTTRRKPASAKGATSSSTGSPPTQGGKKEITVDPTRHCIHLPWESQKRDDRPNDGAVRVDLERGKYYKVTAAGEAFMSEADRRRRRPLPRRGRALPHRRGGLLRHSPDRPGAGEVDHLPVPVAHRPHRRRHPDGVLPRYLWPGHPKRGSYTLTIEETGERANSKQTRNVVDRLEELLISERREASKQIHDEIRLSSDAPKDRPAPAPRER